MKKNGNRKSATGNSRAFTLIELLIVISIIGILSAFTFGALKMVKQRQYRQTATAELKQVELAIERYKAAYGVYPPSNTNNPAKNQLFFELSGTIASGGNYQTLDGAVTVLATDYSLAFNVGGIINCTKGSGEDAALAKSFLPGLKANRMADVSSITGPGVKLLVTSVRGPDEAYQPVGLQEVNPFRYNSANPTNNPNSYDLWVDLSIGNKIYHINNWSK